MLGGEAVAASGRTHSEQNEAPPGTVCRGQPWCGGDKEVSAPGRGDVREKTAFPQQRALATGGERLRCVKCAEAKSTCLWGGKCPRAEPLWDPAFGKGRRRAEGRVGGGGGGATSRSGEPWGAGMVLASLWIRTSELCIVTWRPQNISIQ